jgi:uncharacterized membrane protein YeaQ/YmgE (transglycosylase-associated protein family)
MGILWTLIIGLVVGAIAKLLMPGKDPGGFIVTMLIGVAGALLAGFLGRALGWYANPGDHRLDHRRDAPAVDLPHVRGAPADDCSIRLSEAEPEKVRGGRDRPPLLFSPSRPALGSHHQPTPGLPPRVHSPHQLTEHRQVQALRPIAHRVRRVGVNLYQ